MSDLSRGGVTPLFPKPIPIIGGTGPFGSGKSLFGLTICPGPQTLVFDFEQSCASYSELGHDRINVMEVMQASHPNGYKPVDLFQWWFRYVKSIPKGKYRVIMLDPVTDLERGLTDWVVANPQAFGHTAAQYAKMSGIMWGDVKDYEKAVVADLSARCETLYFTAHLGMEFKDKEATGKMKPKGKTTLEELASVYFWFDRRPDAKGVKPNKPAAKVLKTRLLVTAVTADGEIEMQGVLPPVMPVCTPKALRDAFAKPAGGREIDDIERHVEDVMTEEDRLRLNIQLAEAERDAAQAKLAAGGPAKQPPPPEDEAAKWIADSTSLTDLTAVATKLAGFAFDADVKARLLTAWQDRKKQLAAPKADAATQSTPAG